MDRTARREKAIYLVKEAISFLQLSLDRLEEGTDLERMDDSLIPATTHAESALITCCDAEHDADCKEVENA